MLVDELLERKVLLRGRIEKFISEEINQFVADTNINIDGVYITLTNINEFGRKEPKFVLVNAEVELDL